MARPEKTIEDLKELLRALPLVLMGFLMYASAAGIVYFILALCFGWIPIHGIGDILQYLAQLSIVVVPGAVSLTLFLKYRKKRREKQKTVPANQEEPTTETPCASADEKPCNDFDQTHRSNPEAVSDPAPKVDSVPAPKVDSVPAPKEEQPKQENITLPAKKQPDKPKSREVAPKPRIEFSLGAAVHYSLTQEKDGFRVACRFKEYAHSAGELGAVLPGDYFKTHSIEEFCAWIESLRPVDIASLDRSGMAQKLLDAKIISGTFVPPRSGDLVQQKRVLWHKGNPEDVYEEVKILKQEDGWYYQIQSVHKGSVYRRDTERLPEDIAVEEQLYRYIRSRHDYPDFSEEDLSSSVRRLNFTVNADSADIAGALIINDTNTTAFYVHGWDYTLTRGEDGFRLRHHVTRADGGYGVEVDILLDKEYFRHHGLSYFYDYVSDLMPKLNIKFLDRKDELAKLRKALRHIGLFPGCPELEPDALHLLRRDAGDLVAKAKVSPVVQRHYWMCAVELFHDGKRWSLVIEDVFARDRWSDDSACCRILTPKPVSEMTADQLAGFINTIPPCGPGRDGHREVKAAEVAPLIAAAVEYLRE